MAANVKKMAGEVNAEAPQIHQIGALGDETGPMTLQEALSRVAALTADDEKRRIRPAS